MIENHLDLWHLMRLAYFIKILQNKDRKKQLHTSIGLFLISYLQKICQWTKYNENFAELLNVIGTYV